MKEKTTKIKKKKTEILFLEKINKINKPLVRLIKKKGIRCKSIKLQMKKERLQQIMQKHKKDHKRQLQATI